MNIATDLSGIKFGELTAVSLLDPSGWIGGRARWWCSCSCGKQKAIAAKSLLSGASRSCGCGIGKAARRRLTTHGGTRTREYSAWCAAKTRCYNPRQACYRNYGGRGIVMCDRWLRSFSDFLKDMGRCPQGFTLDRIDYDGPYSPENCRWASLRMQANNARSNHRVTFNGETHTVAQWERLLGFRSGTLKRRLLLGWSAERALTVPLRKVSPY